MGDARSISASSPDQNHKLRLFVRRFALARFRAADHQLAPEEFLVVQFLHCALRFFDRLHLDERETFRALIVAIAHHFGVLHMADAVEEVEEIALGRVEGQIAEVYAADAARARAAVVAAAVRRYAIVALVSFGRRRRLQEMRRCVAKMFSASVPVRVDLENVRARPVVETDRARGAGVSRMNASSC